MQASATPRRKLRTRSAALFCAAAAPIVLASAAHAQLPTPAPRLPAQPTHPTSATTAGTTAARPATSLPAAQPTQPAVQIPRAATQPAPRAYRARVEFDNNQLTIAAENSSLDEILSEIARLTGMKITGGVTDERVYGSYGPDTAQAILNELLDGTGTNVLLLETPQHTVSELVLTPRNGGPTPPSPSAAREEERNEENLPPGLGGRRREFPGGGRRDRFGGEPSQANRAQEQQQQNGQSQQFGQPPEPATGNENSSAQPDAAQQSPNGVRTPQQIYDDLVKQQAQQQQTPTTPPQ